MDASHQSSHPKTPLPPRSHFLVFLLYPCEPLFLSCTYQYLNVVINMTDNPRGEQVVRVTIACGILETFAVALRLLARWKCKAGFGADDHLIVATLIPAYGMLISGSLSTVFHSKPPLAYADNVQ